MGEVKIGFALTGSFCTFDKVIPIVQGLIAGGYTVMPIMSEYAYVTDTRFGRAADFAQQLELACGSKVVHTITDAEPIGPKALLDILIIAPCTSNTLAKLATGINDSAVTMAAKSHLRNEKPLLVAVSTNDALGNSAKNIGTLLNNKHIFFVPMRQDSPSGKPRSMVADFHKIPQALDAALQGKQLQPISL